MTRNDVATPLFAVRGDATPEEVAALVAVLGGLAASTTPAPEPPRSQWSAPHRRLRTPLAPSRDGWRTSTLPR